jgi:L-aspartate oxidase
LNPIKTIAKILMANHLNTSAPLTSINNSNESEVSDDFLRSLAPKTLIIGGGAAGLSAALRLADLGQRVVLLYKTEIAQGASYWAQGGIAVALNDDDTPESHCQDTLVAGAGLCQEKTVRFVVEHAKSQLKWLLEKGVKLTPDPDNQDQLHLTREGGHSQKRIVHADDATGVAVQTQLWHLVKMHPYIQVIDQKIAIDLIVEDQKCHGVYYLDIKTQTIDFMVADQTILATGGASRVYLYTTNPEVASGDGIAMGWRAGAAVSNLEFNQFHPTCLYHLQSRTFLLTEALRGEGAVLRLPFNGERFMPNYHPLAELAPRDVVARAIDKEMKKHSIDYVHLDISHKPLEFIQQHFPNIYQHCLTVGIDLSQQPVPVVPAAHYTCGGLVTDLNGQTNIEGLYAIGEVACTGLHGANRIASNSLLECFVFSDAAVQHIQSEDKTLQASYQTLPEFYKKACNQVKIYELHKKWDEDIELIIAHNWDRLRRIMWDYVGIVRNQKRLQIAQKHISILYEEIELLYRTVPLKVDLIELRNLVQVALLVVESALTRQESRGLHFNMDYPERLPQPQDSYLIKSKSVI